MPFTLPFFCTSDSFVPPPTATAAEEIFKFCSPVCGETTKLHRLDSAGEPSALKGVAETKRLCDFFVVQAKQRKDLIQTVNEDVQGVLAGRNLVAVCVPSVNSATDEAM